MQLDEFGSLYAVAERHNLPAGFTASTADPLVPVSTWQEVRLCVPSCLTGLSTPCRCFIICFTAWSRSYRSANGRPVLPSLLAGLACVAGVYLLGRRFLGNEVGLVIALLAAVDPIQIMPTALARPYALANPRGVLSFASLLGILHASRSALVALLRWDMPPRWR